MKSTRMPLPTRNEAFTLEPSRSDTSTSFRNRIMKCMIILGIVIFCSLLSLIILAIWYNNPSVIAMSDVETITYIVPTEVIGATTHVETTTYILPASTYIVPTKVISTTTQTEVNEFKYECPDDIWSVIVSEEATYIITIFFDRDRFGYTHENFNVYKIQNQRVVEKGSIDDFFVPWFYSLFSYVSGYIRNGSLTLLHFTHPRYPCGSNITRFNHTCQTEVRIYDSIPMQSDKFELRQGFYKKIPIKVHGAIMINDKAYLIGYDEYLIYDERFNNVTTTMDLETNFPNFPMEDYHLSFKGGHTTSFNGQKLLTLYFKNYSSVPQVYTYDLERKKLVGGGKNLTEYLLNCE